MPLTPQQKAEMRLLVQKRIASGVWTAVNEVAKRKRIKDNSERAMRQREQGRARARKFREKSK